MKHLLSAVLVTASLIALPVAAADLVLYTSQPNEDAQATVDAFKAANPGVEVEWVRDGTPKIIAKLQAEIEAGNPVADVLLIADTVTMQRLKEEGRLATYKSPEASNFDATLFDADGAYYSTKMITTGIIYNTAASVKPANWPDLTKPELKGLVTMPSPLTSGAALIHAQTLTALEGYGWDYYKGLQANGATAAGGNGGVLKSVATGEKAYGMVVDYLAIREKAKGAPVEFVFPTDGVSAVTEPVAIINGSKNLENAQKFVDFVLSEAGQKVSVDLGYIPARNGMALPAGFPARDSIKVLPIDAAAALKNTDADLATFSSIFGTN